MIFYNWEKILSSSNGKVIDIIAILRIITYKITPKNYHDRTFKFYQQNFGGFSFLVNPEDLLTKGRTHSDKEVAEYAGVASYRNYHEYKKSGDTTLDLLYLPVSEDIINNNRLLELRGDKIHFLFEETQSEKNDGYRL